LEWRPTVNSPARAVSPIDWAQSIIDANPGVPIILSTHENLTGSGVRSVPGLELWQQLVSGNDQIFMVLNGHSHATNGGYHQVSTNAAGRPVFEVLQNYQHFANDGNGWLRLIEFDTANDKIRFETYSPVLGFFLTKTVAQAGGHATQFEFDFDFAQRFPQHVTPGDHNDDGIVDAVDYALWRENLGSPMSSLPGGQGARRLGTAHFDSWVANYGRFRPQTTSALPEPSLLGPILLGLCGASLLGTCRRR
jgi:hypothetical protein